MVAEIASMSQRLRVTPCWKITTGQPAAGRVRPEFAFGKVTRTGTLTTERRTGMGLATVRLVEFASRPSALNGAT